MLAAVHPLRHEPAGRGEGLKSASTWGDARQSDIGPGRAGPARSMLPSEVSSEGRLARLTCGNTECSGAPPAGLEPAAKRLEGATTSCPWCCDKRRA